MAILKQTLRLEHVLGNEDVLSSEVEFDFEDYDNYVEAREEARQLLIDTISNGRPSIVKECRHSMGMEYSQKEFDDSWRSYQQLCRKIDGIKFRITEKEKAFNFLLYAENRLTALVQMIKTANLYQEFCNLLEASVQIKGSESSKEEKEQLPHLQLPMVFPSEGEAEDKSDQEETITN
ncbi:MAG: hypothetical protein F6K24_02455 [Okeania sp. SIO2D1]|nr:hypothetical protein [Okeania sp. SIO2D1]